MSAILRFPECSNNGKILRSTYSLRAYSLDSDASQAEALPGVIAVLTAADIADLNPIDNGRPVIAMNKVRYVGRAAVAAVAAEALGRGGAGVNSRASTYESCRW